MNILSTIRFILVHPLNRGRRAAAIKRLVQWQIVSRITPGAILLPFAEHSFLVTERGMSGATGNWYCGLHEFNEMAFALHILRKGDVFVDAGANIGSYTILACDTAEAQAISIEPIPGTFVNLQRNILVNGLSNKAKCYCVGLSDKKGTLRFTTSLDAINHVQRKEDVGCTAEIPVETLDELIGETTPLLIKIDVEGHELAVLNGATRTLDDKRLLAVILEVNGSGSSYGIEDAELIACMQQHGFRPFCYDPFSRSLDSWTGGPGNAVFVRDAERVIERCRGARKFELINGTI